MAHITRKEGVESLKLTGYTECKRETARNLINNLVEIVARTGYFERKGK